MEYRKHIFLSSAFVLMVFVLTVIFTALMFPYKKAFMTAFENYLVSANMSISMQDVYSGIASVRIAKITAGHKDVENKPLFVLNDVKAGIDFLSILTGSMDLSLDADLYGGKLVGKLSDLPFINKSKATLDVRFNNVDMSKYPENTFTWLKKISGSLNGVIQKNITLFESEAQRGSFQFELKDGELVELRVQNLPRLILPYSKINVKGKIEGTKYIFDNITAVGTGVKISGTGYMDLNELQPYLNVNLKYEALSKGAPIKGKGSLLITGLPISPVLKWQFL